MYISVDIEANGAAPPKYSMLSIGAVVVESSLDRTFYTTMRPLQDTYDPNAMPHTGFTHEETMTFQHPKTAMQMFADWLDELRLEDKRLVFVSDNAGFDWMYVCVYFEHFLQRNPFGFSSFSLTSFSKGWEKDMRKNHKKYRRTKHSHNALDDAMGNAEAFLKYKSMGLVV